MSTSYDPGHEISARRHAREEDRTEVVGEPRADVRDSRIDDRTADYPTRADYPTGAGAPVGTPTTAGAPVATPTTTGAPVAAPTVAQPAAPTVAQPAATAADLGLDRRAVVARERAEFGGIKVGSAFFGWLTATGMAVLLTALVAGIGLAVGLGTDTTTGEAADQAIRASDSVSIAGAVVLIVIMFLSYYCGGYVAGRMARFNGAKQGLAVWLWALLIAVAVAIVAAAAGDRFDLLARLNGFPRLPINEGNLAVAGIITALILAAAALIGAMLGGMAGMRFHRRVDRAGLEPAVVEPAVVTTDDEVRDPR
jgi:hypothetical protein